MCGTQMFKIVRAVVYDMYSFCSSSFVCDGYHMCQRRQNGDTPLDLATDDTCREILEHHAAVYATVMENSAILVAFVLAHCATLSASGEAVPDTALSCVRISLTHLSSGPRPLPALQSLLGHEMLSKPSSRPLPCPSGCYPMIAPATSWISSEWQ